MRFRASSLVSCSLLCSKSQIIISTLILASNWLFIERILGFQKSPSSCHVTSWSWRDGFINPTWQQTKPSIVAHCILLRDMKFPEADPLSHAPQWCHEIPKLGTMLHSWAIFLLFFKFLLLRYYSYFGLISP